MLSNHVRSSTYLLLAEWSAVRNGYRLSEVHRFDESHDLVVDAVLAHPPPKDKLDRQAVRKIRPHSILE